MGHRVRLGPQQLAISWLLDSLIPLALGRGNIYVAPCVKRDSDIQSYIEGCVKRVVWRTLWRWRCVGPCGWLVLRRKAAEQGKGSAAQLTRYATCYTHAARGAWHTRQPRHTVTAQHTGHMGTGQHVTVTGHRTRAHIPNMAHTSFHTQHSQQRTDAQHSAQA
jgi:hypothetical protein